MRRGKVHDFYEVSSISSKDIHSIYAYTIKQEHQILTLMFLLAYIIFNLASFKVI